MQDVIFAIDACNYQAQASFEAWLRSVGGKVLLGQYKMDDGTVVRERSYLVSEKDFEVVLRMGVVANQESFLKVTRCNKQYAALFWDDWEGWQEKPLGSMCQVSAEEAAAEDNWTYDPAFDRWYVCKHENPDRESMEARKQRELWAAVDAVLHQYEQGPVDQIKRLVLMTKLKKVRDEQKPKWIE